MCGTFSSVIVALALWCMVACYLIGLELAHYNHHTRNVLIIPLFSKDLLSNIWFSTTSSVVLSSSGWNVDEGSDLPGDLRFVGRAAAPGSRHLGPGLLLGLHEGQPAPPELHIEPPPTLPLPLPNPPGRRRRWLKRKTHTHYKTEYLFKPNPRKRKFSSSCPLPFSQMCF